MNGSSLIAGTAKRIAAGWKTRPPGTGALGRAPVEYLYVPCVRTRGGGHEAGTLRWVQAVPIVKKTATLIYFTSDSWNWRNAVVSPGCVGREQFEADTRCPSEQRCRHGHPAGVIPIPRDCCRPGLAGRFFFATREAAERALRCREPGQAGQDAPEAGLINRLRRAMTEAHPDHGGTTEQFIEARRRYLTALP
jgi:hypothetical protein